MKTIAKVKTELEFNRSLTSLIEVLKNIAVAQYRIMEKKMKTFERFFQAIDSLFESIDITKINHPFLNPGNRPPCVIAITSDSGMLGGLNMQIVSCALRELEQAGGGSLVVIGERGKVYARESGVSFVAFGGIKDEDRYFQAMQLRDYIAGKVFDGSIGSLKVVYPRSISFTLQRIEIVSFLPYSPLQQSSPSSKTGVIFESSTADITGYLIYLWMGQKFHEIFGLSRLAEFSARFVHLEESSQKLKDLDNKLRLEYFRIRHELIDRNMRELFSARLLYASQH